MRVVVASVSSLSGDENGDGSCAGAALAAGAADASRKLSGDQVEVLPAAVLTPVHRLTALRHFLTRRQRIGRVEDGQLSAVWESARWLCLLAASWGVTFAL